MANLTRSRNVLSPTRTDHALLVVDMLADPSAERPPEMSQQAIISVAGRIAKVKARAKDSGVPVIYLNETFGRPFSDIRTFANALKEGSERNAAVLKKLMPENDDHFVAKPHRSGFYGTGLGVLLVSLGVSNLIVTGVTTDISVLFTAHDAYMRGYKVHVPPDCAAAANIDHHNQAIAFLKRVAAADVQNSARLKFPEQQTYVPAESAPSRFYSLGGSVPATGA